MGKKRETALSTLKVALQAAEAGVTGIGIPGVEAIPKIPLLVIKYFEDVKANDEAVDELRSHIELLHKAVLGPLEDARRLGSVSASDTLKSRIDELRERLTKSYDELVKQETYRGFKKIIMREQLSSLLGKINKDIGEAVEKFRTECQITTEMFVVQALTNTERILETLESQSARAMQRQNLDSLPLARNSSWDPARLCLGGTRIRLLEDLMNFARASPEVRGDSAVRIQLVTGAAGCGKSTIAHTISKLLHEVYPKGLGSAFFFSTSDETRSGPDLLVSTIAFELSSFHPALAEAISAAIENNRPWRAQPLIRQFESLILNPASAASLHITAPVVVVIDALDEAWDDALLLVLKNCAALPPNFRFIIMSRPKSSLIRLGNECAHISLQQIELDDSYSREDIELYSRHSLAQVTSQRPELGPSWPGEDAIKQLINKAGGLFIWISTACELLCNRDSVLSPDQQLGRLLGSQPSRPLERMTSLYRTVLDACPWGNDDFARHYQPLMGAILALKTPLPAGTIGSLLDLEVSVTAVLQPLSPVLMGLNGPFVEVQPLRITHDSFREFSTRPEWEHLKESYFIDMGQHRLSLTLKVLHTLNADLKLPAVISFLNRVYSNTSDFPRPPSGILTGRLSYACQHLISHLLEVEHPSAELCGTLEDFLKTNLTSWVILCATSGSFHGLAQLREGPFRTSFDVGRLSELPKLALFCLRVGIHLQNIGNLEESLAALREAAELYRQQAKPLLLIYRDDHELATSLRFLASVCRALGRDTEADNAIREALALDLPRAGPAISAVLLTTIPSWRSLFGLVDSVDVMKTVRGLIRGLLELVRQCIRQLIDGIPPDDVLADSLAKLSFDLRALGRHQEALDHEQAALVLFRRLAKEHPDIFNIAVADSLHYVACDLSALGRQQEALHAHREALQLCRQMALEQPSAFNDTLVNLLCSVARNLIDLGRRQEALDTHREALQLTRQMALEQPSAFNDTLLSLLGFASYYLHALNYKEEALDANREALQMSRRMALEQPATYNGALIRSLQRVAWDLSLLCRQLEALDTHQEALELSRQMALEQPSVFNGPLDDSLSYVTGALSALGRDQEALEARQELEQLRRQMALEQPSVFNRPRSSPFNSRQSAAYDFSTLSRRGLLRTYQGLGTNPDHWIFLFLLSLGWTYYVYKDGYSLPPWTRYFISLFTRRKMSQEREDL